MEPDQSLPLYNDASSASIFCFSTAGDGESIGEGSNCCMEARVAWELEKSAESDLYGVLADIVNDRTGDSWW